ncbi:MAG: sulfotransferase family 2 domain-containing protein [Rhodobacteraceae bacterium]|nr:sulfotransferase family 2 domain-containing protein [Paracoccaceae bacterium]
MKNKPFSSFVIFGAMRSGSNLLQKYINQYKGVFCHGELFNPVLIRRTPEEGYIGVSRKQWLENPEIMLEAIRNVDPKTMPGYRIFQEHNNWVQKQALQDAQCAKIILTRDPVESFVSLEIARKTGQWLISDIAHRKSASIDIDLDEYTEYARAREKYYDNITQTLALSGQPYFEIDYSRLNDLETMNRLVRFLGLDEAKTALEQPIKRQNPGRLPDKIKNYAAVKEVLGLPEAESMPQNTLVQAMIKGTDLSRVYFCANKPLAFAPTPSVPEAMVRQWLAAQSDGLPENGFAEKNLAKWQRNHQNPLVFTVVQHPVERAYSAFMHKIFPTGPSAYIKIKRQLEEEYGLMLPMGKGVTEIASDYSHILLEQDGYSLAAHRICFKQFLVFVADNLAGKTDIRQDGKWQSATEIIRRYRILFPELLVFHTESLHTDLAYLENRLAWETVFNLGDPQKEVFSYSLDEIYDEEIESLARAAYGQDYETFGYMAL